MAHCGGESVSRCPANTELFCRSSGRQTGFDEFLCGGNRLRVERRATRLSVALSRRGDAIAGALGDQPPLEVRDGTEDVEHEFAGGRGGVEPLLQADQVDAAASISGAVIATGRIEVETRNQVVEHIDGGTVQQIVVRDGDPVTSNEVLLRFSDALLRSEEAILEAQYAELVARRNRLEAEFRDTDAIVWDRDIAALAESEPQVRKILDGQKRLFRARAASRAGEVARLRNRIGQAHEEIAGLGHELSRSSSKAS